jgi:hypothetical protein
MKKAAWGACIVWGCLWTSLASARAPEGVDEPWGQDGTGTSRVPTKFVDLEFTRDADFTGRLVTNTLGESGVASARVSVLYRIPGNAFFLCETTTDEHGAFVCRGSAFDGSVDARFLFGGGPAYGSAAVSLHWDPDAVSP